MIEFNIEIAIYRKISLQLQKWFISFRARFEEPVYTADEERIFAFVRDRVEFDCDQREAAKIAANLELEWSERLEDRWSKEYRRCLCCGEWSPHTYCIACGNM